MRVNLKDGIASAAVAAAVLAYVLWLVVVEDPGDSGVRLMVAAVLALGFVASAVAVVPGFGELIHGSKTYLVLASLMGLLALASAVVALVSASSAMLAVLVVATILMWVMASVRHAAAARLSTPARR